MKVQGKKTDYAPIKEDASRVIICYGFEAIDEDNATWFEVYFYKKQVSQMSLDAVKKAIIDDIDKRTDEKILYGFVYSDNAGNERNVWLSAENQRNYSEAQRVAQMFPDRILPVTFKLGEQEDGTPVYHEFKSAEELTGFYLQTVGYIQQQLANGWAEKDSIDFSPYEQYFNTEEETASAE